MRYSTSIGIDIRSKRNANLGSAPPGSSSGPSSLSLRVPPGPSGGLPPGVDPVFDSLISKEIMG